GHGRHCGPGCRRQTIQRQVLPHVHLPPLPPGRWPRRGRVPYPLQGAPELGRLGQRSRAVFSFDKGSKAGSVRGSNQNQLAVGIVTDNKDPEGDYRVRVKFPTLPGDDQSWWCRIATFGAGSAGRGMFALPEVDDEVLVAFLHGDFNQPVILATMWNG